MCMYRDETLVRPEGEGNDKQPVDLRTLTTKTFLPSWFELLEWSLVAFLLPEGFT